MIQIFEKVHSKSKPKPKLMSAFEKSKTFVERNLKKKNKTIDEHDASGELKMNDSYANNKHLSIITDTVLGEDYYKYFKQFSELESFEPLSPKTLRKKKVKSKVNNSESKVQFEEIEEESSEEIGCGLYFKIKREIIKSFRIKFDPSTR